MRRTVLSSLVVAGLTVFSGAVLAAPAGAIPSPATMAGSTHVSEVGAAELVTFTYTTDSNVPLTNIVFTTQQATGVPVTSTSIAVDGTSVSSTGAVGNPDVSVSVPSLIAGPHTITFTSTVPASTTPAAAALSKATLDYSYVPSGGSSTNGTVDASATASVNEPDIALTYPAGSGQDQTAPLGTGAGIGLESILTNKGYGNVSTDLVIALPIGTAVIKDGVFFNDENEDPLLCAPDTTTPALIVCNAGSLAHNASVSVVTVLTADQSAQPGSLGHITVTGRAHDQNLVDFNGTNDSKQATVQFTGAAHLSYSLTPSATKVVIGKTVTVTLKLHNEGPQTAGNTVVLIPVDAEHFAIQSFDGPAPQDNSGLIFGGGLRSSGAAKQLAAQPRRAESAAAATQPSWPSAGSFRTVARNLSTAPSAGIALGKISPSLGTTSASGSYGNSISTSSSSTGGFEAWAVGDLASGATATAHLVLKATSAGALYIEMAAISDAGDPTCQDANDPTVGSAQCIGELASVSAVNAPPAPAVHHAAIGTGANTQPVAAAAGTGAQLAATGGPVRPALTLGIGLVLLGGLVLHRGRRRTRLAPPAE